ncbi:coagulation factor IIIb precursor [Danio rerio]|uniref:Tissue factor n=1 Tax=Danio rerio TaxID=7955 RepID=B0UY88_DANRE|nr:coagulation factor IIIb precursor [Danio rerio]|eukprot:NP_001017728.2 coagulation factor IIIb precursor [Danio rerio]
MGIQTVICSALFLAFLALVNGSPASMDVGKLTKATNVSWTSYNFKTILSWGPKPVNYTYTVEFSRTNRDKQRNPHCIRSTETECDLTNDLDINEVYSAEVLSEPLPSMNIDQVEPPYSRSKIFRPYDDTLIGRPQFTLTVSIDKKLVLTIQDPITALHKDNRSLNIRDIFKKNLKYKVAYSKAGSTGKKIKVVEESRAEFNRLDEDQSYCFSVAAYIPNRKGDKRLGEWSLPKCSPQESKSLFEEYGLAVIGGAALATLAFVIAVIVLIVVCCKRAQKQTPTAKETIV